MSAAVCYISTRNQPWDWQDEYPNGKNEVKEILCLDPCV